MVNISISTNVLIFISCIILFIIIGIIAYIIYKDKKNDQAEIDELIDDIVKAKPRKEEKKIKEEVKVQKIEPETKQEPVNLEEMLDAMQQNLDKERPSVNNYEIDQEENAIISYKELIKQKNSDKIEAYEEKQEKEAITKIDDVPKTSYELLEEKEELMMDPVRKAIAKIESPRENKDKKFRNTDFISPIYGKMENKIEYPKIKAYDKNADLTLNEYFGEDVKEKYFDNSLERILNVDPLTDEVKKNDEFLRALKEFRNNL